MKVSKIILLAIGAAALVLLPRRSSPKPDDREPKR